MDDFTQHDNETVDQHVTDKQEEATFKVGTAINLQGEKVSYAQMLFGEEGEGGVVVPYNPHFDPFSNAMLALATAMEIMLENGSSDDFFSPENVIPFPPKGYH